MRNKARGFFALLMLAGCGLMANALGQNYPPNIGPVTFSLNGSSGTYVLSPSLNGQSYCTVTVPSTATMGSGTITLKTSADNGANWFAVTGLPDLGSGASASQTITVAGTQLTAPVSGKTGFELVLSGATGAAITGSIACGNGSGATGSNSGSGSGPTPIPTPSSGIYPVTVVAPTNASGQVLTHDSTPVQPSPLYTQPASCATPNCNVTAYQTTGTNLHTVVDNASPIPVSTVAPLASQSPIPWPAFAHLHVGSGTAVYLDTWPDTWATSSTISSATTTELVAGVANQTMYVFLSEFQLNGTNSTLGLGLEYGQGATCGTNTVRILPVNLVTTAIATGDIVTLWASSAVNGTLTNAAANAIPIIVPANATAYNLCGITAGTTIAGQFVTYYAIHAN